MKIVFLAAIACLVIAWCIFFFTHQDVICGSWWFASDDWCIRYNTVYPR